MRHPHQRHWSVGTTAVAPTTATTTTATTNSTTVNQAAPTSRWTSPITGASFVAGATPSPSPLAKPPSKFSLDHLFRRMRTKSQSNDELDAATETSRRGHRKQRKAAAVNIKSFVEPGVLAASGSHHSSGSRSSSNNNPPSNAGGHQQNLQHQHQPSRQHQSPAQWPVNGNCHRSLVVPLASPSRQHHGHQQLPADDIFLVAAQAKASSSPRSSFCFDTWEQNDSTTSNDAMAMTSAAAASHVPSSDSDPHAAAEPSTSDPTSSLLLIRFQRDLTPDPRTLCSPSSLPTARQYVRHLLQLHVFEIRSTRWAAYFLLLLRRAGQTRRLSSIALVSLRWGVCALVRHEVATRHQEQRLRDQQFQRKMTEYRVAMQCICGTRVIKFGRKGKPHATHLMVENGDTFRWTSKGMHLTGNSSSNSSSVNGGGGGASGALRRRPNKKKGIALASIREIRAGPTTAVLVRALEKGTLALLDAKCTLSLVTDTRTFDLQARSAAEREWLHRSFQCLVEMAREHERQVAQQVELTIMKRMETRSVWKHGRKGKPHKTRLFINRFGEITWQGRTGDTLHLEDVQQVTAGAVTPVFARSRSCGFLTAETASRRSGSSRPKHATSSASYSLTILSAPMSSGSGMNGGGLTPRASSGRLAGSSHCFSLVTRHRTLDIETESEDVRDWYVVAFRYLLDKVHEKSAAMKRDKAEKQVRMLQELCGVGSEDGCGAARSCSLMPAPHA